MANRPSPITVAILLCCVPFALFSSWQLKTLLQLQSQTNVDASIASLSSAPPKSSSLHGFHIPEGHAVALPSVPTTDEEEASIKRNIYGGKGDKSHLGGFTSFDPQGVSPTLWKHMVNYLGIKSLLDVGCGRGISTSWFVLHGLEYVQCVEGSHDAVTQSIIPNSEAVVVEHDFSRGPWWPSRTVDAVWCVEFTEHVGRNYQLNYYTAFRKAAFIFMTHSNWGGWHHVEVHNDAWWKIRMESMGFVYSGDLTQIMRQKAMQDKDRKDLVKDMDKERNYSVAQHIWSTMLVFVNPLVASLPEHAHLMAEHGCYNRENGIECGKAGGGSGVADVTALPDNYKPLILTDEMDEQWFDLIKDLPIP